MRPIVTIGASKFSVHAWKDTRIGTCCCTIVSEKFLHLRKCNDAFADDAFMEGRSLEPVAVHSARVHRRT